jgi:acylphosphatase
VIRRLVLVSGRVQGVYFRDTCRRVASGYGVAGWIRNLPDGRVEAVLEGPAEGVGAVLDWMRHGPERAVVTGVEVRDEEPEGLRGFAVE